MSNLSKMILVTAGPLRPFRGFAADSPTVDVVVLGLEGPQLADLVDSLSTVTRGFSRERIAGADGSVVGFRLLGTDAVGPVARYARAGADHFLACEPVYPDTRSIAVVFGMVLS